MQLGTGPGRRGATPLLLLAAMLPAAAQQPSWTVARSQGTARPQQTNTLLANGQVLSAGGIVDCSANCSSSSAAELYDPATGAWSAATGMATARANHVAVRLANGKVLVAGGHVRPVLLTTTCELYDPETGAWSPTGSLATPRQFHQAALLPAGNVLIMGGLAIDYNPTASAELYDPLAGTWSSAGRMNTPRFLHTTTLLPNGRVLVAGGSDTGGGEPLRPVRSAELYDPSSGTWTATGALGLARFGHTATLLPDGRVLVVGGFDAGAKAIERPELYNPATGQWSPATATTARTLHTATLLPNGKVLVAGGNDSVVFKSAEVFDPASGSWTPAAELREGRTDHTAVLLADGRVLVSGGIATGGAAFFHSPHPHGYVLLAIGDAGSESYLASAERFGILEPPTGGIASVSAASFFDNGAVAPDSLAAAFGAGLSSGTQVASSLPLPQTLAGVTVRVRDSAGAERPASLLLASPGQINFLVPAGTAAGRATVTVRRAETTVASGEVLISAVAPGLFTANSSGLGVAAATAVRVKSDGSQSSEPVARFDAAQKRFVPALLELGPESEQVVLLLFGTGIRARSSLPAVTATIGAVPSEVLFAGPSPEFAGVDQVNVRLPRALAGRGEVDIALSVDGRASNPVRVAFR